jgi:FkbM family methyltransferase
MLQAFFRRVQGKITRTIKGHPDQFLSEVAGVIHVGANTGQERHRYAELGLRVLWIEPIPDVFANLERNIADLPNQRAIQCLLTDKDDELVKFHVANNGGSSSSILDLAEHKGIWPEVMFTETLELRTMTLAKAFQSYSLDPSDYQAMLLDTQGSELLVLRGSGPLLGSGSEPVRH